MHVNHSRLVVAIILGGMSVFGWAGGPVRQGTVDVDRGEYDKGKFVFLENDFYRLEFDPVRGGRCRQFLVKSWGKSLNTSERTSGFFLDHWGKYPWPSGLFEKPYQYEIIGDGNSSLSIRLWIIDDGKGSTAGGLSGSSAGAYDDPELRGLKVQKTITLYAAQRYIDVESDVINPTSESRGISLYLQQAYILSGGREWDWYYFPSVRGIDTLRTNDSNSPTAGQSWIYDPVAGWIGSRDTQTDEGLVFLFDYNYLNKMYSCGMTAEWWYENVIIQAGGEWKTSYKIIPVKGFKGFVHVSDRLLADIERNKNGSELSFGLAGVCGEQGNVKLVVDIVGFGSKSVLQTAELDMGCITDEPVHQSLMLSKPLSEDAVVKVKAFGSGWQESYERLVRSPGSLLEKQADMGMAPLGGQVASAETYSREVPAKIKTFDKPDLTKLTPLAGSNKVLLMFGLYTNHYHIEESLKGLGADIKVSNASPTGVSYFPGTYEEIFSYRLVVLSDVFSRSISDGGWEMLYDYIQQGGTVLVLGGPYTMGNGDFPSNARFRQFLPADIVGPFDMRWPGPGKAWPVEPVASDHFLLHGVSFEETPLAFWVHEVKPKPEAQTILKAGPYVGLIAGACGEGKVVLSAVSCQGDPAPGQNPLWETAMWQKIIRNLFVMADRK